MTLTWLKLREDGNEKENENTIAALNGESVFHRIGQIQDNGLNEGDLYVDLGDEPAAAVEMELRDGINETKENCLPEDGTKKLGRGITRNREVLKNRLSIREPARVPPTKTTLDNRKRP